MTLETQAQFARRLQRDKAHVTRLKQAGRLVMDRNLVDVEASLARIEATRGNRFDVEERYDRSQAALGLVEPVAGADPTATPDATAATPQTGAQGATIDLDEIGRRTRHAQMLEKEAVARIREREEQEQAGVLVRRASVVKAATDAVGVILNAAETLPDRVAPLLVGTTDPARVRAVLRDEIEQLLDIASHQLSALAGQEAA